MRRVDFVSGFYGFVKISRKVRSPSLKVNLSVKKQYGIHRMIVKSEPELLTERNVEEGK